MSKFREFMNASFTAAIGIVLPVLLLAIIFEKAVSLLAGVTTPFAKAIFPEQFAAGVYGTRMAVIVLFILVSLALGFLSQTQLGRSVGSWIKEKTWMRMKVANHFQPALLVRADEMNMLIYVVESVGEDSFLIYVPSAPTLLSGSLYIVPRTDVQLLNVKPIEMAKAISKWGVGTGRLLANGSGFTEKEAVRRHLPLGLDS